MRTMASQTNSRTGSKSDESEEIQIGRALIVDDDPEIGEVVANVLQRLGYTAEYVRSAFEALSEFERIKPDVVISDWRMPGINGIELVTRLKNRDPSLATILMTGFGTTETVIEAFTRGKIDYYVAKPFKVEELSEIVAAAVRERKIRLSEQAFRYRLEKEIKFATSKLAEKNDALKKQKEETELLYLELQERQQEIERTKNYLENLLESSVDAIFSVDEQMNIIFFNHGAEEILGYKHGDIIGEPFGAPF